MRRWVLFFFVLLLVVAPVQAQQSQIGKVVLLSAGTPEDKALSEVTAATDPAKKLELLDKWLAEYGKGDLAILAYEIYLAQYYAEKNYAKAYEVGEKLLAVDPNAFDTAVNLFRLALDSSDVPRVYSYGERIAAILERYKARPPAEGKSAEEWAQSKEQTLAEVAGTVGYVQYNLFNAGNQTKDPAQKAALLERYAAAFPKSPYTTNAQVMVTDAYQQAREPQKMVAFAQKLLQGDPENFWMMIVLADYWASQIQKEQFDLAQKYAKKAIELLEKAQKTEGISDEDWQKQKSLQWGLASSAMGQIDVHMARDAQAVEELKTASPLLKPYDYYFGRNQFFLGFALARMKKVAEARPILIEAAAVESPFKSRAQETLARIGGPAGKAPATRKRP
jgi:tetratricopeptide (TPR) repeat protein